MKKFTKKIVPAVLIVTGFLAIASFGGCKAKTLPEQIESQATIKFISSPDFCDDYMVVMDDGVNQKLYKPQNLTDDLKIDGLQVSLTFKIVSDTTYNCGFAGYVPIINILTISTL